MKRVPLTRRIPKFWPRTYRQTGTTGRNSRVLNLVGEWGICRRKSKCVRGNYADLADSGTNTVKHKRNNLLSQFDGHIWSGWVLRHSFASWHFQYAFCYPRELPWGVENGTDLRRLIAMNKFTRKHFLYMEVEPVGKDRLLCIYQSAGKSDTAGKYLEFDKDDLLNTLNRISLMVMSSRSFSLWCS